MSETEAKTARESIEWLNERLVELEKEAARNVQQRKLLLYFMGLLSERVGGTEGGK